MAYSFKSSLVLHNSLKWLDTTGTSRSNVITLDPRDNGLYFGTSFGDTFVNSSSTRSNYTYLNVSSGGVLVPRQIGVGFSHTDFSSALALGSNRYIGLESDTGFLGIVGGNSPTTGSRIQLYNDTTGGHLHLHAGQLGEIALHNGTSRSVTVTTNGTVLFTPDGNTISASVSRTGLIVNTPLVLTNTTPSTNGSTGALIVSGGLGINGDLRISGNLFVTTSTGNINFDSTTPSTSSTTGAIRISGGLAIACTVDATNVSSGGGITCSGGLSVLKGGYFGGAVTILNTSDAINSVTGSLVTYGGIGANGTIVARSATAPQMRVVSTTPGGRSTFASGDMEIGYTGSEYGIAFGTVSNVTFTTGGATVVNVDLVVPKGTRPPAAQAGSIRFNTVTNQFEGFTNTTWGSIGGIGSASDLLGTTFLAPEFSIGSGDGNLRFVTKNTERMRINSAGNIGIATSDPACTLDVHGACNFALGFTSGNSYVEGTLDVLNDSTFYGAITNASDERLKTNIVLLSEHGILDKIKDIRPIKFDYRYSAPGDRSKVLGFIAQDFLEHFPEVTRIADGYYTLDYSKVTVILLMCIKELSMELEQLKHTLSTHTKHTH